MSTQVVSPLEPRSRGTKREQITDFFLENLNKRFTTHELHIKFGSAFRSRVSEINRLASSKIRILNQTHKFSGGEVSEYFALPNTQIQ